MSNMQEAALALLAKVKQITLCDEKRPLGQKWHEKAWTRREIEAKFQARPTLNVGIVLGPASKLVDFEIDSPEGERSLRELFDGVDLPHTPKFRARRGDHHLFQWDDRFERVGKATLHYGALEFKLGAGGRASQSIIPPSVADGVKREWAEGCSLKECDPAPLPEVVIERILQAAGVLSPDTEDTDTQQCSVSSVCTESSESSVSSVSEEAVKEAIDATLPSAEHFRNRAVFNYARRLRALFPGASFEILRPYVRRWHEAALPNISTKEFDVTWRDFTNAWKRAKYAYGEGPLGDAYAAALDSPIPPAANDYELVEVKQLIALCYQLQVLAAAEPFYLSCRDAAGIVGMRTHHIANRWLNHLVYVGVLELVRKSPGRHLASEYRYIAAPPLGPDPF